MDIPSYIKEVIEKKISSVSLMKLAQLSEEVMVKYREGEFSLEKEHLLAYLVFRFPATFSAIYDILYRLSQKNLLRDVKSFLDLGAGPCTGVFALHEFFSSLEKLTLFERDPSFLKLGKDLLYEALPSFAQMTEWVQKDIEKVESFEGHDLVLMAYSLGELSPHSWKNVVTKAWSGARKTLILIEPGTPRNFERMKEARNLLLSLGGNLIAPCPSSEACPMQKGNWCHFTTRVSRSSFHRLCKKGSLGHEDEKFSYLVFSKEVAPIYNPRIIRHPKKMPGHVSLSLCKSREIKETTISKRDKDLYKKARKAEWGDEWPEN